MQFPFPHQSGPAPGLQKQLHPSCTGVDSADWEKGWGRPSVDWVGKDVKWLTLGVQTNGESFGLGKQGVAIKGLTEGSILFPHSSQLGQRWPSDSCPLQRRQWFLFIWCADLFLKEYLLIYCNIDFDSDKVTMMTLFVIIYEGHTYRNSQ